MTRIDKIIQQMTIPLPTYDRAIACPNCDSSRLEPTSEYGDRMSYAEQLRPIKCLGCGSLIGRTVRALRS
jgi:DNA-directed RNA polymerase subunit RPC12/RpoP